MIKRNSPRLATTAAVLGSLAACGSAGDSAGGAVVAMSVYEAALGTP